MGNTAPLPYWRLSLFYFFYFAALGALIPYLGLYLKSQGLTALEIGSLMAILQATKIVAPNLIGWLADHLQLRMRIVRAASLLALLFFSAMFWSREFFHIALVIMLFSFFWNASLPQYEVVTLGYLKTRVSRYSLIRLWGSIGFIVMVVGMGIIQQRLGPETILPAVTVTFAGILVASFLVNDPAPQPHQKNQGSIFAVLRQPAILAFFGAVFLMQMSHGPYYAFYSIFMVEHGYSTTEIGGLWALGVVAEIGFFLVSHRVLNRWGGKKIMAISLVLAAMRWTLLGEFVDSLAVMLLVQSLHAASFGSFHAAAIHLVHHYFSGRHQGRGQALYASLSFGAGGALGSLLGGLSWDSLGPVNTYNLGSIIALLGAYLVWRYMDKQHDY